MPEITQAPAGTKRTWSIKVISLLLFIQAIGLITLAVINIDWSAVFLDIIQDSAYFVLLLPLGLLALINTGGFIFLNRWAWILAMLVQGICLALTLIVYFFSQPAPADNPFLFAILLYSVVTVIYLNYAEVPALFRSVDVALAEDEYLAPAEEPQQKMSL